MMEKPMTILIQKEKETAVDVLKRFTPATLLVDITAGCSFSDTWLWLFWLSSSGAHLPVPAPNAQAHQMLKPGLLPRQKRDLPFLYNIQLHCWLGHAIGSHPLVSLGLSTILLIAAGLGLLSWVEEVDNVELFMPHTSRVRADALWVEEHFEDDVRFESVIVEADNVLDKDVLLAEKPPSKSPDRDSNLYLPVIGSLAQHETCALANYAIEVGSEGIKSVHGGGSYSARYGQAASGTTKDTSGHDDSDAAIINHTFCITGAG
uniref:Uncharacterized protein n=1 Tax=Timema monikensis TaxID=170555 RepID=A0A7R9HLA2_9NEOP|nr:unnamed protein product [Timema monikensis]